jgi:hypothetical protein
MLPETDFDELLDREEAERHPARDPFSSVRVYGSRPVTLADPTCGLCGEAIADGARMAHLRLSKGGVIAAIAAGALSIVLILGSSGHNGPTAASAGELTQRAR